MGLLIPDLERDLLQAATRRARPARNRRRWAGLIAIGAVLVAGGATAAVVSHHGSDADPRVKSELGVLRRPVTAADRLPSPAVALSGFQVDQARRARTVIPGWRAWVVPGADGSACLFDAPPGPAGVGGAACFRVKDIVRARQGKAPHPMTMGLKPKGVAVAGLVPDGVDHVTVRRSDGTSFDARVLDNVYIAVSTTHSTASVSYAGPNGPVTTDAWSPGYLPPPPRPTAADRRASAKARTNPSAARPVHVDAGVWRRGTPKNVGTRRIDYAVLWRARISGGAYSVRLRAPAGCTARDGVWLTPHRLRNSIRGRQLSVDVVPPGDWYLRHSVSDAPTPHAWCRGTYKVDVAWVGNGHRYPPFGTGSFIVR